MSSKLDVLTAIATADAYDRETETAPLRDLSEPVAASIESAAMVAGEQTADEPGGTAEAFESGDARDLARQEVAARAAAGLPELSGKTLGKMFGYSDRWGRDRIAEVRRSAPAASPATAAASPAVKAAHGAASGANAPVTAAPADQPGTDVRHAPATAVTAAADDTAHHGTAESPAPVSATAGPAAAAPTGTPPRAWPVLLLALPAFVAIWGGWVGLGEMAGFGLVNLLPGIGDGWTINTAITLPIGVEAYAAYALWVWLSGVAPTLLARRFAMWSALGSLVLGMGGQVSYHLLKAAGVTVAPWQITTFVSCLPVVVLGCGAALAHLLRNHERN
ncbi:hypothetical protein ACIRG5_42430 [Lentzea sp. NPDC102401]|uniref:hypothetical protein n=1 Tax=Lentzea sp. NPDC102401 TaxID=3364128 RepID=UPI0037F76D89